MKKILLGLSIFITTGLAAQFDTLHSGVYSLVNSSTAKKQAVEGSTTDLADLKMHSSTLAPGQTNHAPRALNDFEELIIVKDGSLQITINDSSKILSAGSIAMIIAGDKQSFSNVSNQPATYYVLGFKAKALVNILRGKEGGGSFVKDWNELTIKKTDKGESRPVFSRASSMFPKFDVHVTTLNPGFDSHPPHQHRAEEIMLLLKGTVTAHIGNASYKAAAGDAILIAPNVIHNVTNTGSEGCTYYAIQWHHSTSE